jgi:hypothetical protein
MASVRWCQAFATSTALCCLQSRDMSAKQVGRHKQKHLLAMAIVHQNMPSFTTILAAAAYSATEVGASRVGEISASYECHPRQERQRAAERRVVERTCPQTSGHQSTPCGQTGLASRTSVSRQ